MKQPKGCMAEGYAMEESMGFLMEYMQDFKLVSRRMWDIKEEEGVGGSQQISLLGPYYLRHCPSLCPH
jgi:hypothetical protein